MGFFLSWLVAVVFIILGGLFLYPMIRAGVKFSRQLKEKRWQRGARQRALTAWSALSHSLPLTMESSQQPHRLALTGHLPRSETDVTVESFVHKDEDFTRITLQTDLDPTQELFFIEAQSGYQFIDALMRRNPTYLPQQMKRFDRNFMVLGKPGTSTLALALLSDPIRTDVDELIGLSAIIHLRDGTLTFEREGLFESSDVLARVLELLKGLVDAIALDEDAIPGRLLDNFREDPDPALRLRHLKALLTSYPESSEAAAAEAEMLDDPAPEVRLFGAMRMGDEGLPIIEALAEDPDTPEPLCIEAYKYLATQLEGQQSLYAVKVMLLLLNSDDLNSVAVIPIARAIERFGAALDEDTCLELLAWEQHPRVAYAVNVAACKLLARCGTVKSIPPLMQREKTRNRELRKAVDRALLHIKTRLGHTEAGGLSLVEEDAFEGALSGTERDGAISLVEQILTINQDPELQDDEL